MAELREVVSLLGHADVMTYIQSGNVLFTPRLADGSASSSAEAAALAALCEQLNQTGCTYPGTDLTLRYEVKPHPGPA